VAPGSTSRTPRTTKTLYLAGFEVVMPAAGSAYSKIEKTTLSDAVVHVKT
jgi:hypothetical protein